MYHFSLRFFTKYRLCLVLLLLIGWVLTYMPIPSAGQVSQCFGELYFLNGAPLVKLTLFVFMNKKKSMYHTRIWSVSFLEIQHERSNPVYLFVFMTFQ